LEEWIAQVADLPLLQVLLVASTCVVSEDPVVLACGVLVAAGKMPLATALGGLTVGILGGDLLLFAAGRALRRGVGRGQGVDPTRLTRIAACVNRHGAWMILAARCLPGTRLATYVAVGALGVPWARFLRVAAPATVAWALLLLWAIGQLEGTAAQAMRQPAWLLLPAFALLAANALRARRAQRARRLSPPGLERHPVAAMRGPSPAQAAPDAAT
jgi:membrane protein DedA with SNARE-associated domain